MSIDTKVRTGVYLLENMRCALHAVARNPASTEARQAIERILVSASQFETVALEIEQHCYLCGTLAEKRHSQPDLDTPVEIVPIGIPANVVPALIAEGLRAMDAMQEITVRPLVPPAPHLREARHA